MPLSVFLRASTWWGKGGKNAAWIGEFSVCIWKWSKTSWPQEGHSTTVGPEQTAGFHIWNLHVIISPGTSKISVHTVCLSSIILYYQTLFLLCQGSCYRGVCVWQGDIFHVTMLRCKNKERVVVKHITVCHSVWNLTEMKILVLSCSG